MSSIDLSVILITASNYRRLRKTIRHLADQDIADRIQLIVVCQDSAKMEIPTEDVEGLGEVTVFDAGTMRSTGEPRAQAVAVAKGTVTAFAEDHCFPQPGWARAILDAHAAGHTVVGPSMSNANPKTSLSWADLSLNFGPSVDQHSSEGSSLLCWHNTSYSTELLQKQDDLETLLEAEGVLFRRLEDDGQSLFRTAEARVHHINISSFRGFLLGQFWGTRLFWATLTSVENWSWAQRMFFAVASPALAVRRFFRGLKDLRRIAPGRTLSAMPYLVVGSIVLTTGAVAGLLRGPGNCMKYRLSLEFQRELHLVQGEEQILFV